VNLREYRQTDSERERTADLLNLFPKAGQTALDIGARDGHFSLLLAERFERVIALDLEKPAVVHPRVQCVKGNATELEFSDREIDFVFCAEVLEHVPTALLTAAGQEIQRVTRGQILIGVPYRQDLRVGRTTCYSCMGKNPPWGHVNSFDEGHLLQLFPGCKADSFSFVGTNSEQTNAIAAALMDLAGNPYGTYLQDEPCIHCGRTLIAPAERNFTGRVLTKLASWSQKTTGVFARPRGNWMHVLLSRNGEADEK